MKRVEIKSLKHKYKVGGFEAGMVKGSKHPRNNIWLKISGRANKYEKFDFTIDEAAAIISCLSCAIVDYTHDKRDLLKP